LTSFENEGVPEIYLYDAATKTLDCPSCRQDGGKPLGEANIGTEHKQLLSRHYSQAVTDDGQLFFDTPDPLVAADANSSRDVYEWSEGEPALLSRGTRGTAAYFEDATQSGNDVFFVTNDQLVGQDRDVLYDLYDARVGGGIAAQNPDPPRGECSGQECEATPAPNPPPLAGSGTLAGPGNVKPQRHRRCHRVPHRGRTGAHKGCGRGRHNGRKGSGGSRKHRTSHANGRTGL